MSISRPALICAILALAPLAARGQETPPERPKHVAKTELADNGKHKNVPHPKHFAPGPNDKPVVWEFYDFYQKDQQFAELFAPAAKPGAHGPSEICGPTALANVLAFLKFKHEPRFPKICDKTLGEVEKENKHATTEFDLVDAMFKLCHTSKTGGTGSGNELEGAKEALAEGGYSTEDVYRFWEKHKRAPAPRDLAEIHREGKMAVLLFGWYDYDWDAKDKKWKYKRVGGHFVTLAGYDAVDPLVIYVCNPCVDYKTAKHFSRLFMWPTPNEPGYVEGMEHHFQTEDLAASLGVLEDALVVYPR
jgi:hypothetical protein